MKAAKKTSRQLGRTQFTAEIEGRRQDAFPGTALSCDRGDEKTFRSSTLGGEDGTETL
jgi:hypothetical protein